MAKVIIYTKGYCPYCVRAKDLLKEEGLEYEEISLDDKSDDFSELRKRTGLMTVPQIFIDQQFIGGYQELAELSRSGRLKKP